nr:MAG TPA: hypothetical protein [Caudoviricetes sp.]
MSILFYSSFSIFCNLVSKCAYTFRYNFTRC